MSTDLDVAAVEHGSMSSATIDRLDADTFTALWHRHHRAIRNWLYRRCPPVADDLAAETFSRAWAGRHTFQPGTAGSVRGWLYAIANHVLVNHWRRAACRVPLVPSSDFIDILLADTVAGDGRDVAGEVADRGAVVASLAQLPPGQRRVLAARYLLDLDAVETAALLGCPVGTVKSTTHYGLRALRARLTEVNE